MMFHHKYASVQQFSLCKFDPYELENTERNSNNTHIPCYLVALSPL
jgi:hypothetical protein